MSFPFSVRPECPADVPVIAEITREAFLDVSYSQQNEHIIIESLRQSHTLSVSLVAEVNNTVVGHIAFSPVSISDNAEGWFGLGPISVRPALQRRGIGRALVQQGLGGLRSLGAQGCVVLGEPAFYFQFGFQHRPELVLEGVPQEFFLSLSFGQPLAVGRVTYHQAFHTNYGEH